VSTRRTNSHDFAEIVSDSSWILSNNLPQSYHLHPVCYNYRSGSEAKQALTDLKMSLIKSKRNHNIKIRTKKKKKKMKERKKNH